MPFDPLNRSLSRRIDAMARYYAVERVPDLERAVARGLVLLQEADTAALQATAADPASARVRAWPVEDLGVEYPASERSRAYRVVASDGSSEVADPHSQAPYVLLHIAQVLLGFAPGECETTASPTFLYHRNELEISPGGEEDEDAIRVEGPVVDTMRAYGELEGLWQAIEALPPDDAGRPLLAVMDAIMLWTHRGTGAGGGHKKLHDDFLLRSTAVVEQFRRAGVPLVSFTSDPHHREVVNTLLAHYCPATVQGPRCPGCQATTADCETLHRLQDRDLFRFLPRGSRSGLFRPMSQGDPRWRLRRVADQAVDPRLGVCYLQTEGGIARVEVPLWVAEAGLLPTVQGILLDQGRENRAESPGYPLALSLAHDEAVLKTGDRRTVLLLVEEAMSRAGVKLTFSPKTESKRR